MPKTDLQPACACAARSLESQQVEVEVVLAYKTRKSATVRSAPSCSNYVKPKLCRAEYARSGPTRSCLASPWQAYATLIKTVRRDRAAMLIIKFRRQRPFLPMPSPETLLAPRVLFWAGTLIENDARRACHGEVEPRQRFVGKRSSNITYGVWTDGRTDGRAPAQPSSRKLNCSFTFITIMQSAQGPTSFILLLANNI